MLVRISLLHHALVRTSLSGLTVKTEVPSEIKPHSLVCCTRTDVLHADWGAARRLMCCTQTDVLHADWGAAR